MSSKKYPLVTFKFVAAVDESYTENQQLLEARDIARQLRSVLYESSWKRGGTSIGVELFTADQIALVTFDAIQLEEEEEEFEDDNETD